MTDIMWIMIGLLGTVGLDLTVWTHACEVASDFYKSNEWVGPWKLGLKFEALLPRYIVLFSAISVALISKNAEYQQTKDILLVISCIILVIYLIVAVYISRRILMTYYEQLQVVSEERQPRDTIPS